MNSQAGSFQRPFISRINLHETEWLGVNILMVPVLGMCQLFCVHTRRGPHPSLHFSLPQFCCDFCILSRHVSAPHSGLFFFFFTLKLSLHLTWVIDIKHTPPLLIKGMIRAKTFYANTFCFLIELYQGKHKNFSCMVKINVMFQILN